MPGGTQTSGGSDGTFTEGALSFLRSTVASASKDIKKAPKPNGKAFQTAHDSSGWDRKARWQRALNLARDKMGVQGVDESADKWGAALRETEGGDRRGAPGQPARLGSSLAGIGGCALAGAPGTIAELRTSVALKEHLKRGRGAREAGIQLVTLEGGSTCLDVDLSEKAAAAMVAQFEQRRQMLGGPLCPGRAALSPANRALRAWTNPGTAVGNGPNAGSSSSSSSSVSSISNFGGVLEPAMAAGTTTTSSTTTSTNADTPTTNAAPLEVMPSATVVSRRTSVSGVPGIANGYSPSGSAGFAGASSSIPRVQRRFSESGSIGGTSGGGGSVSSVGGVDCNFSALRRLGGGGGNSSAVDSIIARPTQPVQRLESDCHHRLLLESHFEEMQGEATDEALMPSPPPPPPPEELVTHELMLQQEESGAASVVMLPVESGKVAGSVPTSAATPPALYPETSGGGSGALRPTQRHPFARVIKPAQPPPQSPLPPAWLPTGRDRQIGADALAGPSPLSSSIMDVPSHLQRQASPVLPVLQIPSPPPLPAPLRKERSCSPPRLMGTRGLTSTPLPSAIAPATNEGITAAEPLASCRPLDLTGLDCPTPSSPGLLMVATSPAGGGNGLLPVPPAASLDSASTLPACLRRLRPRTSLTGECSGAGVSGGGALPSTSSGPLPLQLYTGWTNANSWTRGAEGGGATVVMAAAAAVGMDVSPPPAPSRLMMQAVPASPSASSPTRLGAVGGYRRVSASTSSLGTQPLSPQPSSSPPMTMRVQPHNTHPATPSTPPPASPSPPPPSPSSVSYRRPCMPTSMSVMAIGGTHNGSSSSVGGAAASTVSPRSYTAAPHQSPPQTYASPSSRPGILHHRHQQHSPQQLRPLVSVVPVRQSALTHFGGGAVSGTATAHRRLTDDGGMHADAGGRSAAAAQRATPASDAVLAGLRAVAVEVADELSREAEMAAMTRQALAVQQRSRLRVSESGKPRHISLPGDPWHKWG